jgi:hypothetical protein
MHELVFRDWWLFGILAIRTNTPAYSTEVHWNRSISYPCSSGAWWSSYMGCSDRFWLNTLQIPTNLYDRSRWWHGHASLWYFQCWHSSLIYVVFQTKIKMWIARWSLIDDYSLFYVPLKNFSLIIWKHHRTAKCRPMLGAQDNWAGSDLYRATPVVTWDFGLKFRSLPMGHLIQSFITYKRMWGI